MPGANFKPGDLVEAWTESVRYSGPALVISSDESHWDGWDYAVLLTPERGLVSTYVYRLGLIQAYDRKVDNVTR